MWQKLIWWRKKCQEPHDPFINLAWPAPNNLNGPHPVFLVQIVQDLERIFQIYFSPSPHQMGLTRTFIIWTHLPQIFKCKCYKSINCHICFAPTLMYVRECITSGLVRGFSRCRRCGVGGVHLVTRSGIYRTIHVTFRHPHRLANAVLKQMENIYRIRHISVVRNYFVFLMHTIRLSSTKITKFINICVWLFLCWWPYRIRIHGVQTITPFCHAMCIYRWIEITTNKKHFFTIHIQLTVWWLKWSKCVHTAIHTSKPILYKCRTYTSREWTYAFTNGIRDLSANCVLVYPTVCAQMWP